MTLDPQEPGPVSDFVGFLQNDVFDCLRGLEDKFTRMMDSIYRRVATASQKFKPDANTGTATMILRDESVRDGSIGFACRIGPDGSELYQDSVSRAIAEQASSYTGLDGCIVVSPFLFECLLPCNAAQLIAMRCKRIFFHRPAFEFVLNHSPHDAQREWFVVLKKLRASGVQFVQLKNRLSSSTKSPIVLPVFGAVFHT